jgi:hypothetical protein
MLSLVVASAATADVARDLEVATPSWTQADRAQAEVKVLALVHAGIGRAAAIDRLEEWRAKGADPARSLALLGAFAGAAQQGRAAVDAAGLPAASVLVESAAAASAAGASQDDLTRTLSGASSVDEGTGRCLALSTLSTSGFAPTSAAEVIALAAQRGYRRAELSVLLSSVQRLAREGVAPREVLIGQLSSAVRSGVRPGELYPTVLKGLGGRTPSRSGGPESGFNHPVLRTNK